MVLVTAPEAAAPGIARSLVERRVAACVSVTPGVRSVYRWEGTLHDDPETLLIIKTVPERFDALLEAVRELHPYQVPEVLALPVERGSPPYTAWVRDSVIEGEATP